MGFVDFSPRVFVDVPQELKCEENSVKAVQCLNEMVTNALSHVEDSLTYMSTLRDPAIFRFCAIPQVFSFLLLSLVLSFWRALSKSLCFSQWNFASVIGNLLTKVKRKLLEIHRSFTFIWYFYFHYSWLIKDFLVVLFWWTHPSIFH